MKKSIKFLVFGILSVSLSSADAWLFSDSGKKDANQNDKVANDKKKTEDSSIKSISTNSKSNDSKIAQNKTDESKEKSVAVSDAVKKDAAVIFSDGTVITKDSVDGELRKMPTAITSRMAYPQLLQFVAFRQAYRTIIANKVKELKLEQDPDVIKSIKQRRKNFASSKYLNKQVDLLMTDDDLKQYYNEIWERDFKNTQEFSGTIVIVSSEAQGKRIVSEVKNEEQLNKIIEEINKAKPKSVNMMPLNDYPESGFPVDISKQIKAKGANSVIGPFSLQGMSTLFFVKSIHPAVKKPFTNEFKTHFKQVAKREFTNRFINNLFTTNKVVIYNLHGKPIDLKSLDKFDAEAAKKNPVDLSKIKDDFVIAKIGDSQKLKISDLYEMFNVKTLENELFGSMAIQLKVSMEEVIQSAIKLCVQDRLISDEIERTNFSKDKEIVEKFTEIEAQQLRRAYFNKTVRITETDARKEFNKYLKIMQEEKKNDQELSVRLLLFSTQTEADTALKSFSSNPKQFNSSFEKATKESGAAVNLGYIRNQESDPVVWNATKSCPAATCCKTIINVDGAAYGFPGKNFAIAHVGDRRPIQLPTFEETSAFFRKVAEKLQAVTIMEKLFSQQVAMIDGESFSDISPDKINKELVAIITDDTERSVDN